MITNLTISRVEAKTSKAGKQYHSVYDSSGKMHSVFEADVIAKIQEHLNEPLNLEVVENNGFSNIRKFHEVAAKAPSTNQVMNVPVERVATSEAKGSGYAPKAATMLCAYAKDLVVAGLAKADGVDEAGIIERMNVANRIILESYKFFNTAL